MQSGLIPEEKDALGRMLCDYLAGEKEAFVRVASPDLSMTRMTGKTMFRTMDDFSPLEKAALGRCRGKILDAGAGAGCHSLALQEGGADVSAIDISPGCVRVMAARGVAKTGHASLFSKAQESFDTILMLMNGIGLTGTIQGLNYFFQYVRDILAPGGQVLADSTDLASMYTSLPVPADDAYYGETVFSMSYRDIRGDPFEWLYIDYATLAFYAEFHGWRCDLLFKGEDGKYLVRLH